MIDNLTITFECDGITHTLNVPTRDDNLPDNLATAFIEVINQSEANANIVINDLKDEFFSHCEDRTNLCCATEKQIELILDEKKMTNKELALVLLQTVEQFGELPLQIVYEDVNLIGEDIRVELDQSCSKNSKAISIYTD